MWENILRNTLVGLMILSLTSTGIKNFNPTDMMAFKYLHTPG